MCCSISFPIGEASTTRIFQKSLPAESRWIPGLRSEVRCVNRRLVCKHLGALLRYWTELTEAVIQPYLDFRDRYKVPIWLGEFGENTEAWIRHFVRVVEKNEVGWAFWPYKKMDSGSSFVSWSKPPYWDDIVAFGKLPDNTGGTEKRISVRPSLEHARAALWGLLDRIELRA